MTHTQSCQIIWGETHMKFTLSPGNNGKHRVPKLEIKIKDE